MIRFPTLLAGGAALALWSFSPGLLRAADDNAVAARRTALELAGAWTNDGFKLRDGSWFGQLERGARRFIQVNLFAGNEYWFSVAADSAGKRVAVAIYDEAGQPLEAEPYAADGTAAAGFSPEASGPYVIAVEQLDGDPASVCLVYSYK